MDKSITLLEALTGFQFTIEHLDGRKIKVATQPGEVIVHTEMKMLRGHGMPFFQDEMSHGNLFVKFTVNFPKKGQLKPKQIKALKKVLPGPKHAAVDYKSGQFEVLDEYDQTDFNPKAAG
jgi:DnaJ family protein A protein 2